MFHVLVKSSDLPAPLVSFDTQRKIWRLEAQYDYYDIDVTGRTIRVPRYFEFDLASIPRVLWSLIAPFELSIVAPLLHDFLYRGQDSRFTRGEADKIFKTAMALEGIGRFRRNAAYLAVRVFGKSAWKGK